MCAKEEGYYLHMAERATHPTNPVKSPSQNPDYRLIVDLANRSVSRERPWWSAQFVNQLLCTVFADPMWDAFPPGTYHDHIDCIVLAHARI